MSLVVSKKRNGGTFPTVMDDFLNVNPLFGSSLFDFNRGFLGERDLSPVPKANIIENEKDYRIELAVPGLDRDDFNVEMKGNMLVVSAEKEEESKNEERTYRSREFSYRSFYRTFTLPENLVFDKIEAKYQNGVLNIVLPKKEVPVSKPVKHIKVA